VNLKTYFITDPSYYSNLQEFIDYLRSVYQHHRIDYACFRDKKNSDYEKYAKVFITISHESGISNTLLNTHIDKAKELGFKGVHLTSNQHDQVSYAKSLDLFVIASTHEFEEVIALKKSVDAITFSPIFSSPNKGKPKGVKALEKAVQLFKPKHCFALGGIVSQKEIQEAEKTGVYGFASIRYFVVK
jgi:thiamine-phosphate pyrophosphorylase